MNDRSFPAFHATVAADGSGDYETVQEAVDAVPENCVGSALIHIRPGVYRQKIKIEVPGLTLEGEDAVTTILTWDDSANREWPGGGRYGTFRSYTAYISGDGFEAKNLTFENSAGEGTSVGQAVAASVTADRAAFYGCRFIGCQDTLFTGPLPPAEMMTGGFTGPDRDRPRRDSRQYYERCLIRGDIDFIFGSATAVFNRCRIEARDRGKGKFGYLTAASTPEGKKFGYVFLDCDLAGDAEPDTYYLGRPWRNFARTVYIRCRMGAHIRPEGFWDWDRPEARRTVYYAEYGSAGPGAGPARRAPWVRLLTPRQATGYTIETILSDGDGWNPETVPANFDKSDKKEI